TRNYHNILVNNLESDVISVECNFTTHRTKREVVDTFIGKVEYELVHENNKLAIKSKKVMLNLDSLRPHGKVSLILYKRRVLKRSSMIVRTIFNVNLLII